MMTEPKAWVGGGVLRALPLYPDPSYPGQPQANQPLPSE